MLIIKARKETVKEYGKSYDYLTYSLSGFFNETVLTNNDSIYESPWYVHFGIWAFYSQIGLSGSAENTGAFIFFPA